MSKGARREITRDDDGNLGERGGHPAADAMDWDEALRVIAHLKADGDWRGAMLIACGCYLGLRISDMLRLRWQDVTQEKDIRMREQKTGKLRMMRVNAALARTASECYVIMRSAGGKARAEDYVLTFTVAPQASAAAAPAAASAESASASAAAASASAESASASASAASSSASRTSMRIAPWSLLTR